MTLQYITKGLFVDFQKTTCFNSQTQNRQPTTVQPRPSRTNPTTSIPAQSQEIASSYTEASSSASQTIPSPSRSIPPQWKKPECVVDCACSDDEMDEISEKRQSIFEGGNPGPSGCSGSLKIKVSKSASTDSSSFEELETNPVKTSDDNWQFIEKTSSNGIESVEEPLHQLSSDDMTSCPSPKQSQEQYIAMTRSMVPESTGLRKLTRRRSDSSLLSLKKSNSITIDTSAFDASQSGSEVKKLKISCNKCGKAKSNIKTEIMKLSEQLRSSNKSEAEINAKIKEFLDYLESKSQPSEMTETENSQLLTNQNDGNLEEGRSIQPSTSHDEIGESIFDENEGINVYSSAEQDQENAPQSSSSTPRRFMNLDDIHSRYFRKPIFVHIFSILL